MKFSYEDESRKVEYEVCNSEGLSWHTLMDHYANFLHSLGYENMEYRESRADNVVITGGWTP